MLVVLVVLVVVLLPMLTTGAYPSLEQQQPGGGGYTRGPGVSLKCHSYHDQDPHQSSRALFVSVTVSKKNSQVQLLSF